MNNKNKRAAMEMSVGAIVTIVLLVTVLILGLVLVKNIFASGKKVIDLTTSQLEEEVNRLFGEDKKLVIYPRTEVIQIKQGETDGVGIGIKNLQEGVSGKLEFFYEVVVADASNCVEPEKEIESWIVIGKTEKDIPIPVGEKAIQRVLFKIPTGSSLCIVGFRVNVYIGDIRDTIYASEKFYIEVKPK